MAEIINVKVNYTDKTHDEFIGENKLTNISISIDNISDENFNIILSSKFRRGTGDLGNIWNLLNSKGIATDTVESIEISFNQNKLVINNISSVTYNVGLGTLLDRNGETETLFTENMTIKSNKNNEEIEE